MKSNIGSKQLFESLDPNFLISSLVFTFLIVNFIFLSSLVEFEDCMLI